MPTSGTSINNKLIPAEHCRNSVLPTTTTTTNTTTTSKTSATGVSETTTCDLTHVRKLLIDTNELHDSINEALNTLVVHSINNKVNRLLGGINKTIPNLRNHSNSNIECLLDSINTLFQGIKCWTN